MTKKVKVNKIGDTLYIEAPRNKFIPSYVYYMLENFNCTKVTFKASIKIYLKESLKNKDDWKQVK